LLHGSPWQEVVHQMQDFPQTQEKARILHFHLAKLLPNGPVPGEIGHGGPAAAGTALINGSAGLKIKLII
jgi:hypothetical protein